MVGVFGNETESPGKFHVFVFGIFLWIYWFNFTFYIYGISKIVLFTINGKCYSGRCRKSVYHHVFVKVKSIRLPSVAPSAPVILGASSDMIPTLTSICGVAPASPSSEAVHSLPFHTLLSTDLSAHPNHIFPWASVTWGFSCSYHSASQKAQPSPS